jgi:hypothetical protein
MELAFLLFLTFYRYIWLSQVSAKKNLTEPFLRPYLENSKLCLHFNYKYITLICKMQDILFFVAC